MVGNPPPPPDWALAAAHAEMQAALGRCATKEAQMETCTEWIVALMRAFPGVKIAIFGKRQLFDAVRSRLAEEEGAI